MFDIGFWEMLVFAVMGLIILGPERLPGAIRSTMNTIRSVKDVANGFKQEVASQLDAHELHANLKRAEGLGMESLGKELQDSVDELKAAAASVQQPYKNIHSDFKSAAVHSPAAENDIMSKEVNKAISDSANSGQIEEQLSLNTGNSIGNQAQLDNQLGDTQQSLLDENESQVKELVSAPAVTNKARKTNNE